MHLDAAALHRKATSAVRAAREMTRVLMKEGLIAEAPQGTGATERTDEEEFVMTSTGEKVRKGLESELARVNRAVEALKKEPRAEEQEGFGDNTPLSEEIDAILAAEEREFRTDRLGRLLDRAAALDEAIHRFDRGLYGICISCGEEVAQRRLSAIPEALRCNRCQESFEKAPHHEEIHGHEWKLAEEAVAEQRKTDESSLPPYLRHPRPEDG